MLLKDSSHSHLWDRTVRSSNNEVQFYQIFKSASLASEISKHIFVVQIARKWKQFQGKNNIQSEIIPKYPERKSEIFPRIPPVRTILTDGAAVARQGEVGRSVTTRRDHSTPLHNHHHHHQHYQQYHHHHDHHPLHLTQRSLPLFGEKWDTNSIWGLGGIQQTVKFGHIWKATKDKEHPFDSR